MATRRSAASSGRDRLAELGGDLLDDAGLPGVQRVELAVTELGEGAQLLDWMRWAASWARFPRRRADRSLSARTVHR